MCCTGHCATCSAPNELATLLIPASLTGCPALSAAANEAVPSVSQAMIRQSSRAWRISPVSTPASKPPPPTDSTTVST
ncbi:hypothetical protein D3C73_995310 [compost metagenome]